MLANHLVITRDRERLADRSKPWCCSNRPKVVCHLHTRSQHLAYAALSLCRSR